VQTGFGQPGIQVSLGGAGMLKRYHLHGTAKVTAQHHCLMGGPSGREFPQNLLSPGEEHWNKWYVANFPHSWVMIEFHQHLNFAGIGFKSAGDHPRRDPTEVRVAVHHPLTNSWQQIAHVKLHFGLQRWHTLNFFEIHGSTRTVKFEFENHHGLSELQLGEIIFYHH